MTTTPTAPLTLEAAPEIAAIREALDAGPTPGPWHSYTLGGQSPADVPPGGHIIELPKILQDRSVAMRPEDARYIAACNPTAMTAVLATIAHLEARLREAEARLPEHLPVRVQVSYAPGEWDTFIFGVSGALTMEALTAIDASIQEDAEYLFDKGPGEYLLSASYFKGQYGFEGRCEIEPGWELSIEAFTPIDAAIAAHGKDAQ